MVFEIKNKVVLITGAAGGIGAWVVRYLVEEDVKHVAILDVAVEAGTALQDQLNTKYGDDKVKFFECDVTDDAQLFGAFAATKEEYGYIDVVINNAGILNERLNSYKKEIEINFTAVVTSTLKALELMRKDKGGKGGAVINISSAAALHQFPVVPVYYGTKSAILQFSCCLGFPDYYDRTGVRVITVCFLKTDTALFASHNIGTFDEEIDRNLNKYFDPHPSQKPESAARAVMDAYKSGNNGSVWISGLDKPAKDITKAIKEAYGIMSKAAYLDM